MGQAVSINCPSASRCVGRQRHQARNTAHCTEIPCNLQEDKSEGSPGDQEHFVNSSMLGDCDTLILLPPLWSPSPWFEITRGPLTPASLSFNDL